MHAAHQTAAFRSFRNLRPLTRALVCVCGVVWIVCAVAPNDRLTWALEQIATVIVVVCLIGVRSVRLSDLSLIGLAVLFVAHTTGTHFTYSATPYDPVFQWLTGHSLNDALGWDRNHYDRLVHLLWGLCLTLPMQEFCVQRLRLRAFAAYHLSLHLVLSTSAIYELLEWSAAVVFGEGGTEYLGTQGDVWDAQADIAISIIGWAIVAAASLARHQVRGR